MKTIRNQVQLIIYIYIYINSLVSCTHISTLYIYIYKLVGTFLWKIKKKKIFLYKSLYTNFNLQRFL